MPGDSPRPMTRPSVEDTLLIHDLYARYSWALDTGDTDAYVQLYLPDAVVYETVAEGVREVRGHEEIRRFVMRFHGNPAFPGRQHRTSAIVIAPDPEGRPDHWMVRAYVLTTEMRDGGPPSIYWCGHTTDILARSGGDWCIASRDIRPWAGDVLARFAGA